MKFELRWIDVNDQLPPENGCVMVNCKPGHYGDYIPQMMICSAAYLHKGGVDTYSHWSYLPPDPLQSVTT